MSSLPGSDSGKDCLRAQKRRGGDVVVVIVAVRVTGQGMAAA